MNNNANHAIRPFIVAPITRFLKTYRDEPFFDITEVLLYGEDTTLVVGRLVDASGDSTDCFFIEAHDTYFALGQLDRAHPWLKDKFRKVDVSVLMDFGGSQRDIKHVLPDFIKVRRRRFISKKQYPNYLSGAPLPDDSGYLAQDLKAASVHIEAFSEFRLVYRINLHSELLTSVIYASDNETNRKVITDATPVQKVGVVHRHSLRRARGRRRT